MATRQPGHIDFAARFGLMMATSACVLAPLAWLSGGLVPSDVAAPGRIEALVFGMAVVTAVAGVIGCHMIRVAGALFSRQSADVKTVGGIIRAALPLDGPLSAFTWGAIALILLGLYLVGPGIRDARVDLERSFSRRARPGAKTRRALARFSHRRER